MILNFFNIHIPLKSSMKLIIFSLNTTFFIFRIFVKNLHNFVNFSMLCKIQGIDYIM